MVQAKTEIAEERSKFGSQKTVGIIVALILVGALAFTIGWAVKPGATGASVSDIASGGMSSEGFSSYEEMMNAHHPDQASSGGMSSEGF